ncbi:electron transfer flavoprotein subunit alpha/FixB family protein [Flavobacteriaceae bacterium Ap0902]|nr:electron transfer flavoprotein subunit alpha/FixB family protein [Flavobacteriaceae bacterium Ap0902]
MSILVYTETQDGKFKKNAFEAVSYAKAVADKTGDTVTALAIDITDASELYQYGADNVKVLTGGNAHKLSPEVVGKLISDNADGNFVVLSHSAEGSSYAPFVAHNLGAALITNVIEAPESTSPLKVKRKAFSGKGIMLSEAILEKTVLTVATNAYGIHENAVEGSTEEVALEVTEGKVNVESVETNSGSIDLKEAAIVVSGGRGLKGPENWGMIEALAEAIGGATAASKPVSDMGWRPHSEHVGQTGKAIAPNLYIAIGISGAIQHLAGVNASKNIVVINNDAEAPFFGAADYGIVGDAFEVVPKLTEAIKKFKS